MGHIILYQTQIFIQFNGKNSIRRHFLAQFCKFVFLSEFEKKPKNRKRAG